ncbi:hypothetical protein GQ600_3081 [Phytophthora cactorum]|nr:hypothetical protein GQ600_3081 [Phytophthora cactorum]
MPRDRRGGDSRALLDYGGLAPARNAGKAKAKKSETAATDEEQRSSLTRGIQMDILLKIKEIFTQSLPKDFVLDADSIWDLNSVLAVSMPSRCYYGIESIKDFWRTSLRMRNKGKIRSFFGPGCSACRQVTASRSSTSSLSHRRPICTSSRGQPSRRRRLLDPWSSCRNGHRVTLHVECFGWLIWRYLLTNEPFPEATTD